MLAMDALGTPQSARVAMSPMRADRFGGQRRRLPGTRLMRSRGSQLMDERPVRNGRFVANHCADFDTADSMEEQACFMP